MFTKHSHAPPVPRSYLHFRPRTGTAGSGGLLPPAQDALLCAGLCLGLELQLAASPGAGGTASPEPIHQEPSWGGGVHPQTLASDKPREPACERAPPGWLLTILQRPLDVTCAFTHCVKVSIQSGYEEQCFWDSHSAAFEALRTETLPLGSRARLGDEPPQPGLSHTAQQTPLSPARRGSRLQGRAPGSLLVPGEARLGRKIIYFLAPAY